MSYKLTVDNGKEKRTVKTGGMATMMVAALQKIDTELGEENTLERTHARSDLLTKCVADVNGYRFSVEPDDEE